MLSTIALWLFLQNAPTFQNQSSDCVEIDGYLLGIFFFKNCFNEFPSRGQIVDVL